MSSLPHHSVKFPFPPTITPVSSSPNRTSDIAISCCRQQQLQNEIYQVRQQLQAYQYQLQKQEEVQQRLMMQSRQKQQQQPQPFCLPSIFYFPPSPSQSPSPIAHVPLLSSLYSPSLSDHSNSLPSPMQFTFPPVNSVGADSSTTAIRCSSPVSPLAASLAQNVLPVVSNVTPLAQNAFPLVPSSIPNSTVLLTGASVSTVSPYPHPSTHTKHQAHEIIPVIPPPIATARQHKRLHRQVHTQSDDNTVVIFTPQSKSSRSLTVSKHDNMLVPSGNQQELPLIPLRDQNQRDHYISRGNNIVPVVGKKKFSLVPILSEQESSFILQKQQLPSKSQCGSQKIPIRPPKGSIPLTLHPHVAAAMGRSSSTPGLVESSGRVPLEEMWVPPFIKLPPPSHILESATQSPAASPSTRLVFFSYY